MNMLGFDSPFVTNALQMTGFTPGTTQPYGAQTYQANPYGSSGIYDNSYYNNNVYGTSAQGILGMNVNAPANFAANLGGMFGPLQTTSFPANLYASYSTPQTSYMPTDPFSTMSFGGAQTFGAFDPMAMMAGGQMTGGMDVMSMFLLGGLGGAGGSSGSYSMLDLIRDVFNPILGIDKIEEKADKAYSKASKAEKTAKSVKSEATEAKTTAQEAKTTAEEAKTTAQEAKTTAEEAKTTAEEAKTTAEEAKATAEETLTQTKASGLKDLGVSDEDATKLLGISVVDTDGKPLSDDQITERIKDTLGPSATQIDKALDILKLDKAAVQKEALTDAGLTGFRTGIMAVNIKNADGTPRSDDEIKADLRNLTHAGDGRTKLTDTQIESALAVLKYEDTDVEAAKKELLVKQGLSEDYAQDLLGVSLKDDKGNALADDYIKNQMKDAFEIPYDVKSVIDTLKLGIKEA